MKAFLFSCFLLLFGGCFAQLYEAQWADSVAAGAIELIIYDSTSFRVQGIDNSYLERSYMVVVLKDPLQRGQNIYLQQDKFKTVEYANVVITGVDGEISKLKLKDFQDVSTKGFSLASDDRLLVYNVRESEFPYTVKVEYKTSYIGSMFYPVWQPQEEGVAVISSVFTVSSDEGNSFRYQSHNVEPEVRDDGKWVRWSVEYLPPFEYENYSYDLRDYGPVVFTAPNKFQMEEISGNMNSWSSFGDWIQKLNFGRDDLDPIVFNSLDTLVQNCRGDIEKVRTIYDYMQDRTRYVSIQLGIGGWQPFKSNFVHESGYGDCKALSFYTQSLLTRVGIDSYYTLIRAGEHTTDTEEDFPMSHFNHAILTVPIQEDTVWLECTSQTNPFGYLGTFTSDRNALLIKPGSSEIIRTKKYSLDENVMSSNFTLEIDMGGSASVNLCRNYSGIMVEERNFNSVCDKDAVNQKDWFFDSHDWSSMDLKSLNFDAPSNEVVPKGQLQASFRLRNAGKKAGKRLFIPIRSFINSKELIVDRQSKRYPFTIDFNKTIIDSLKVVKPIGYYTESSIKDIEYSSEFGTVSFSFTEKEGTILLVRKLEVFEGEYNATKYESFQQFVSQVKKIESKQLVLVSKT